MCDPTSNGELEHRSKRAANVGYWVWRVGWAETLLELGLDVSNSKLLEKVRVAVCSGGSVPRESLGSNTNQKYSVADGLLFSDPDEANDVHGRSQDAHGMWEVARVASHGTQDLPGGIELSHGRRPCGVLSARTGPRVR